VVGPDNVVQQTAFVAAAQPMVLGRALSSAAHESGFSSSRGAVRSMKLTKTQRRAIEHQGDNLQLIACAGSGKTEVVPRRVVHLLTPGKGGGLAPRNIIAFTFTDKAAAELKERIITRCREALGEVTGLAEMFVGTIHAFCLELLKTEAPKYLKYEVLNEVQQGLFVDRHSQQSGLTTSRDLAGAPLKRYRDTPYYISALSILREAEPVEKELKSCSIVDGLEAYRFLLDTRSYLDYSAILETAVDVPAEDSYSRCSLTLSTRWKHFSMRTV
jgi:ATP-dependent DNA helicase UvrD/PcrA